MEFNEDNLPSAPPAYFLETEEAHQSSSSSSSTIPSLPPRPEETYTKENYAPPEYSASSSSSYHFLSTASGLSEFPNLGDDTFSILPLSQTLPTTFTPYTLKTSIAEYIEQKSRSSVLGTLRSIISPFQSTAQFTDPKARKILSTYDLKTEKIAVFIFESDVVYERRWVEFKTIPSDKKSGLESVKLSVESDGEVKSKGKGKKIEYNVWSFETLTFGSTWEKDLGKREFEILGSSVSENCVECPRSKGYKTCKQCLEKGSLVCVSCDGSGAKQKSGKKDEKGKRSAGKHFDTVPCKECSGNGRIKCRACNGLGRKKCDTCNATGTVKKYSILVIERGITRKSDILSYDLHGDDWAFVDLGCKRFTSENIGVKQRFNSTLRPEWVNTSSEFGTLIYEDSWTAKSMMEAFVETRDVGFSDLESRKTYLSKFLPPSAKFDGFDTSVFEDSVRRVMNLGDVVDPPTKTDDSVKQTVILSHRFGIMQIQNLARVIFSSNETEGTIDAFVDTDTSQLKAENKVRVFGVEYHEQTIFQQVVKYFESWTVNRRPANGTNNGFVYAAVSTVGIVVSGIIARSFGWLMG